MANEYTGRFKWPIPPWNADWQKWQQLFKNLTDGQDATSFALLEHLTFINHTLPTVEITNPALGDYRFTQVSAAVFISRTYHTRISVGPNDLGPLVRGALIGCSLQPGAVGPQDVEWEQYVSQTAIDASVVIVGVVNSDYSITWFNASNLPVATPRTLFDFATGGGGSGWMSGVINPNGVVTAMAGTPYRDTVTGVIYMNIDDLTTWSVI